MKTLLFLLALPLAAQTTQIGGMATIPDVTAALNQFIISTPTSTAWPAPTAIATGDLTVQLPASIASACSESYGVVTLTSASNTSTLNVQTANVPIGTRVTIAGSLTAAYNTTFATTSVASSGSGLTLALTIADGTYTNASPNTNGYPLLTYARCAVLVDSEVIGINGTTDGTNYTAIHGDMGTTAAAHASGAIMTMLPYSGIRAMDRATIQALNSRILSSVVTPAIAAQNTIITNAQATIAKLKAAAGN